MSVLCQSKVNCKECDDPIPTKRMEAMPETVVCVNCRSIDDVKPYMGIRMPIGEAGQLTGCEDNIIRNQDKLKDLKFPTRRVCK